MDMKDALGKQTDPALLSDEEKLLLYMEGLNNLEHHQPVPYFEKEPYIYTGDELYPPPSKYSGAESFPSPPRNMTAIPNITGGGGGGRTSTLFDLGKLGMHTGERKGFSAAGRVGVDADAQGYGFGGGAKGHWYKGQQTMPEVLRQFGGLMQNDWGAKGVQLDELDAYFKTPSGKKFEVRGNPIRGERAISARVKIPF
jgi:hypothetical protein